MIRSGRISTLQAPTSQNAAAQGSGSSFGVYLGLGVAGSYTKSPET